MNQKKNLLIAFFLLIIVGVIMYYEVRFKEFRNIDYVTCYVVKKGYEVPKGQELSADMFLNVKRNRVNVPDDYIKNQAELKDKIALESLFEGEILRSKRVIDKNKWCEKDERYVWITSKLDEGIAANDLKPGDKVDILLFDPSSKTYAAGEEFEGLDIQEIKDKESLKYMESHNKAFIIQSICFKMTNPKYEKLLSKIKAANGDFKVSIHGNRSKIERKIIEDNSVMNNLTK